MNKILWTNGMMKGILESYLAEEEAGTGKAYDGRVDWVPDSEESDSDEPEGSSLASEGFIDSFCQLRLRVDA